MRIMEVTSTKSTRQKVIWIAIAVAVALFAPFGNAAKPKEIQFKPGWVSESPSLGNWFTDDGIEVWAGLGKNQVGPSAGKNLKEQIITWNYTYKRGGPHYKVLSDDSADIDLILLSALGKATVNVIIELLDESDTVVAGHTWADQKLQANALGSLKVNEVFGNLKGKCIKGFRLRVHVIEGTATLTEVRFNWSVGKIKTASCSRGGTEVLLKIGCQDEPKTLNIWKATDVWTTHAVNWFYPSLYYRRPVTLEPLPDICTISYADLLANSPDGLTYTFPLRDDVTWDDGMPLTAYDFEFTYTVIMELEIPDYIPAFEDVEYLKAVDDYTLEIKLAKCSPQFEESVIYHFVVPKQQFEPLLIEARETDMPMQTFLDMAVDKPVSAGPFSFGQWEKGAFVKLVTNPDYYGKGRTVDVEGVGTITEGPDYDGLLLKLYGTTDAALLGIQKGEIDFIWWNLDPGYIAQVLGNPDVTIEKADELGFYYLAPNCAKEPFDDMKLRQAMVYLVQKDFIVNRVLQGYGGSAHSVVMPAAGEWYNDNVNHFGHYMTKDERIAKAVEILTAAGYTVPDVKYPEGVVLLPDGTEMQPFEILTPPADYDPMRAMSGVLIQEWWREIGIPVTAKPTSFGEIVHKTFEAMTFDWYILGWRIGGAGYPDHMRYFFHSDQAVPDGNNPMSYKNPECDKALEDLMTLCDHDELVAAAHKAQELIVGEVGYCALYYRTMNEAHRNDTFEGWFTQLGGIAGTESPRHCLPYLKPITEKPAEAPAETEAPAEEEGTCLGTILLISILAAGAAVVYRRRN